MSRASPLLCFYADDFTGATDALDALHVAGVSTTLLLDTSEETAQEFSGGDAIGLAGTSRAMTPAEMDEALPEVFQWMRRTGASVCHYKVCSTFDSAPQVGNIGHAIRLAQDHFDPGPVPVVVGAPRLGRYVAFGNLFAKSGAAAQVHRLDRHPVMSRHPVTPMHESDLARVLRSQAQVEVTHTSLADMAAGDWPAHGSAYRSAHVFDTVGNDDLKNVGSWIAEEATRRTLFCVGSSGVETGLVESGALKPEVIREAQRVDGLPGRMVVVSGSCSSTTSRQIDTAVEAGFFPVLLDVEALARVDVERQSVIAATVRAASAVLARGQDPIIYSAKGVRAEVQAEHAGRFERRIGECLGAILCELLAAHAIDRVAVAGGDTSGRVTRALGATALTVAAHIDPGAPLCELFRRGKKPLLVALKGGQMGFDDYFLRVRDACAHLPRPRLT
jgi:uncharacterized protein YgbK (DUF1537 family)